MYCENYREMISPYIDGMLTENERAILEKHVLDCDECKNELEEIKFVTEHCHQLEKMPLPVDFKEQLHSKLVNIEGIRHNSRNSSNEPTLNKTEDQSNKIRRFNKRIKASISIAASLLLLFSVFKFMNIFTSMKKYDANIENYAMNAGSSKSILNPENLGRESSIEETTAAQKAAPKAKTEEMGTIDETAEVEVADDMGKSRASVMFDKETSEKVDSKSFAKDIRLTGVIGEEAITQKENELDTNTSSTQVNYNIVQVASPDEISDIKTEIDAVIKKYGVELVSIEDYVKEDLNILKSEDDSIAIKLSVNDKELIAFIEELERIVKVEQLKSIEFEGENVVIITFDLVD